ncbi:Vgb family protein [Phaeovulum sp. W22_SRMD_FR3]|uniref:Vgb family protein n=1 Tax=Phaeovulum sp. W22_SRMD_FR3 TaxID=3240274 RepID=UPI003F9B9A88
MIPHFTRPAGLHMAMRSGLRSGLRSATLALSLAAGLGCSTAMAEAQSAFSQPAPFSGMVRIDGVEGQPIYAGTSARIMGQGFVAGQPVTLMRGTEVISPADMIADSEGKFSFDYSVPQDAALGQHPIVVTTEGPDSAEVVTLKVSPELPLLGADKFDITSAAGVPGLYQLAYSVKNDVLFATAAVGRPPVKESQLIKLDPKTLEVQARVSPAAAPAGPDGREGGVFAVYGVAVDDAHGTVWVTNTRQSSVAVYRQDDLSLVKQFPVDSVSHPRDVVIDTAKGRAYVSAARSGGIEVFDTDTLEQLPGYTVTSAQRGQEFTVMSLAFDARNGALYTVSMDTPEAARIDLASGEISIIPVPGASRASGVAYDAASGRLFVASQGSDDLIVLDAASGKVLEDVPVGAGSLNVAYDAKSDLAFVANRASDSLTVVDAKGEVVGNFDAGSYPNFVIATPDGRIFAVNKSRGAEDPEGDRIWRIVPKS